MIYETRPLDTVNDSITEVLNGQIKARLVFEM
ncbi:Alcohol dehydrogenase [Streptomyces formicae]|uniref:Alcohol dehydrogenase n=1 Tax=Streptomyces formicae TaxID=1616117 RepID=A0A291QLE9_9ACTN|nr:Alcohol dehydrogenase [Streptomyces formicae]